MKHLGTKTLSTNRLVLKKFDITMASQMFNNWSSSNKVTKYLTWHAHKCDEETKSVIKGWVKQYENKDFYHWAITLKETKEVIGSISVVELDNDNKTAICGYCVGEKWWGKGYTAEAYKEVISFLFSSVGVKKIIGRHDKNNINSGKVMIKCGLKYVKTLKNAGSNISNPSCDLMLYEITK